MALAMKAELYLSALLKTAKSQLIIPTFQMVCDPQDGGLETNREGEAED